METAPELSSPGTAPAPQVVDIDLGSLQLNEETSPRHLERFMPYDMTCIQKAVVADFCQILTWNDLGHVNSPNPAGLDPRSRDLFGNDVLMESLSRLPGAAIRANKDDGVTYGSAYPVSPVIVKPGASHQWFISAAHVTSKLNEQLHGGGLLSNQMLGGHYVEGQGMTYSIEVHGFEDRAKYKVSTDCSSPPLRKPGQSIYQVPGKGRLYSKAVDVMLLKVQCDAKVYKRGDEQLFYVPSGSPSETFVEDVPIAVIGYPGKVSADTVSLHLGRLVEEEAERVGIAAVFNEVKMAPNRRGLSFGQIVSTNGSIVKHSASTTPGMSGGVGVSLLHPWCIEMTHTSNNIDAPGPQELLYNRGVSKDAPFYVCMYVDKVLDDLQHFKHWGAGQLSSLVTWLKSHKETLKQAGLWHKVLVFIKKSSVM